MNQVNTATYMHVHTRARFHSQEFILSFNPIADQILNDSLCCSYTYNWCLCRFI